MMTRESWSNEWRMAVMKRFCGVLYPQRPSFGLGGLATPNHLLHGVLDDQLLSACGKGVEQFPLEFLNDKPGLYMPRRQRSELTIKIAVLQVCHGLASWYCTAQPMEAFSPAVLAWIAGRLLECASALMGGP